MKLYHLIIMLLCLLIFVENVDVIGKLISKILIQGAKRASQTWQERVKNTPPTPPSQPVRQKSPSETQKSPKK